MELEYITNRLLYVPFNHDYIVDENVKIRLTEKEFFDKCFFKPDFDLEIQELLSASDEEVKTFEVDLTKEELIEKYERKKQEEGALYNWVECNQNDIYCIKGDAGTGKSTFLHYLQYKYKTSNVQWRVIDIQKAINPIKILGQDIDILNVDNSLYSKAISSIILCIRSEIFGYSKNQINFEKVLQKFRRLENNYKKISDLTFPSVEIREFFENVRIVLENEGNCKEQCAVCAEYMVNYFNKLFEKYKNNIIRLFEYYIELYIYILRCSDLNIRYMLAFDNFERFVGVDEIYSRQLTEFVISLRNIQNSLSENDVNLSMYYQIIIFMRNTSTRMFMPQQTAELFPHSLDLSEWFQISKILEKKLQWYDSQNMTIKDIDRLMDILNDIGCYRGKFRGLRSKLNMLFNNNKRVIVRFLAQILARSVNKEYLVQYDFYKKNEGKITPSYSRFAARIIIFRLVLNELRNDGFFKHIIVQKNNDERRSLGYARKILSILYDYKLQNADSYMEFSDVIKRLYSAIGNAEELYFNSNNNNKRIIIAQVLFYMNYYDGRTDNWLQFVDIQYNIPQEARIRIKKYENLKEIIDNNYQNIKIKITSAGIAYLYFVVYSFEYFACKSIFSDKKKREYGISDLPPLLCTIPNQDDILYKDHNELTCIKILRLVSNEVFMCIETMNEDEDNIGFRRNLADPYISHKSRIINSQSGFIDNFIQCMKEVHATNISHDETFEKRFNKLVIKIEGIRDKYLQYKLE